MDHGIEYNKKLMTAHDAAKLIKSNDRIMSTMNGAPYKILNAIGERYNELDNVKYFSELLAQPVNFMNTWAKGHVDVISCFKGPTEREAEKKGVAVGAMPYQIHQHEEMIKEEIKPTVAVIHVTPFDEEGFCTFGPSPVGGTTIVGCAETVIAQVNDKNPRILAPKGRVHISQIDAIVEISEPITQIFPAEPDEIDNKVASHIVERIKNGSTLQIGIGGIANAVGYSLENHRDLGVHTEMYTESMVALMKKGAINNSKKSMYKDFAVIGFAQGTQAMYDFIDNNEEILCLPVEWIANPFNMAKNNKLVSINAMMGIDLLGQVSSESVGYRHFSGTGGQLDFVRGAQMSEGGMSVLATRSTVRKKDGSLLSKICFAHAPGTAITVPRTDVEYVCTEYGIVNLKYKSVDERARLLISIAHPQFRDELMNEAKKVGIVI